MCWVLRLVAAAVALAALLTGCSSSTAGPSEVCGGALPGFLHGDTQVGGARLHWVRGGQGSPVVLIHGTVLHLPRVAVVGHDMGGMTAYAWARSYPAQVDRLVLSGAGIPGFGLEEWRRLTWLTSPGPAGP